MSHVLTVAFSNYTYIFWASLIWWDGLFKGTFHLFRSALIFYGWIGLGGTCEAWFLIFSYIYLSLNFYRPFEILKQPSLKVYQFTFLLGSVKCCHSCRSRISSVCLQLILLAQSESIFHLCIVSSWLNLLLTLVSSGGRSSSKSSRSVASVVLATHWQQAKSTHFYMIK